MLSNTMRTRRAKPDSINVLRGRVVHLHEEGTHAPETSKQQMRKNKQSIATNMATNRTSVATQMNQRIDRGDAPADLPKERAVYDARTALRSAQVRPGPSARHEWQTVASERGPRPGDPVWRLIVDPTHSLKDSLILVFRCRYLISLAENFAKKAWR